MSFHYNNSFWLYLGLSVQWLISGKPCTQGREGNKDPSGHLCGIRCSKLEGIHKYLCVSDISSNIMDVSARLTSKETTTAQRATYIRLTRTDALIRAIKVHGVNDMLYIIGGSCLWSIRYSISICLHAMHAVNNETSPPHPLCMHEGCTDRDMHATVLSSQSIT